MNYSDRGGVALVVSAPSGAGKTTLVKRLLAEFPRFSYSVSCTTRPPRPGEVDGKDYHFLDRETFLARAAEGYFAEWAEVHGNCYGTPLAGVCKLLSDGRDLLLDIDVQGALQLQRWLAATYLFILPPSLTILEERLRGRGQEEEAVIQRRLRNAREEIAQAGHFDLQLVNDDLEAAYLQLKSLYLMLDFTGRGTPDQVRRLLAGERL